MARLDERLRRDLERAARPADPSGVYDELIRRREHRRIARRIQAGALALVVIAGTVAGVYGLSQVFRAGPGEQVTPAGPRNGSIVFSNMGADGHDHLFTIDPDGTGLTQLTDFRTNDSDPTVSPDGRTIAFAHELDTGQRVIASIPFTGGGVTWLTDRKLEAGRPAWSPDGDLIAFAAPNGGIFVMRPNGTGVRQLTEGEVFNALNPTWSPDGSHLAFMATTEPRCGAGCETGLPYDLFQIDIEGSDLVNLTQTPDRSEVYPSWSPDGNVLAISIGRSDPGAQGLYLIDPDGGVHESPIVPTEYAIDAAWSPDGRFLVFQGDADPSGKEFDTQLWIVRPDGRDLHRITVDGGSQPAWQALPEGTTAATPTPITSPDPEAGRDIGLGFPVCNVTSVQGRFGEAHTVWTAYVATKRGDVGPCPNASEADNVVAIDVTGDGQADVAYGPFGCQGACSAFAAPDIDGDGTDELLVQDVAFSIAGLRLFEVGWIGGTVADGPFLSPVTVAPPGDPAGGFEPGKELRLWLGGDAFELDGLRCESGPDGRVLVATTAESRPHDSPDAVWFAHETTFILGRDGTLTVIGTRDFQEPATSEVPSFATRGGLCGARLPYPYGGS